MTLKQDYNYFDDRDYSDYRELICYERPTAVLLHYEHNITYLRLWLYDRFDFEWKNGELVNRSNSFDNFLKKSEIVKYDIVNLELDKVENFINSLFDENANAVLVNYFSRIGESLIVSILMLERDKNGFLATSLRGDSFYIRRPIFFDELKNSLHIVNKKFEYFTISVPVNFPISNEKNLRDISLKFNLHSLFKNKVNAYLKYRLENDSITGAKALSAAYEDKIKNFTFWENKIKSGFDNALLVEFFWPIQFAYKPFLIYLGYLERNDLLPYYFDYAIKVKANSNSSLSDQIRTLLEKSESRSEILSNLSILFGKRPTEKRFNNFINQFKSIIENYEEIEDILFPREFSSLRGCDG